MAKKAERGLAAVLAADVVGYSRLMEADEAETRAGLAAACSASPWWSGPDSATRSLRARGENVGLAGAPRKRSRWAASARRFRDVGNETRHRQDRLHRTVGVENFRRLKPRPIFHHDYLLGTIKASTAKAP